MKQNTGVFFKVGTLHFIRPPPFSFLEPRLTLMALMHLIPFYEEKVHPGCIKSFEPGNDMHEGYFWTLFLSFRQTRI